MQGYQYQQQHSQQQPQTNYVDDSSFYNHRPYDPVPPAAGAYHGAHQFDSYDACPPPQHHQAYDGYDSNDATYYDEPNHYYQQQHQQDEFESYPLPYPQYGYAAPPAVAPPPAAIVNATCFVCHVQRTAGYGQPCSRRCAWVVEGGCPQCGRRRLNESAFCSPACLGQSRRANWCPGCGVRQIGHGHSSCGEPRCVGFVQRMEQILSHSIQQQQPTRQAPQAAQQHQQQASSIRSESSKYSKSLVAPHQVLANSDPVAMTTRQQLGFGFAPTDATAKMVTVKLGAAAKAKKAYTAQRCRVESQHNESCGVGAPKFGHGGEGNEQRRFIILRNDCGAASAQAKHCRSPSCECCEFFAGGLRRAIPSDAVVTWNFAKASLRHARAVVARHESSSQSSSRSGSASTNNADASSSGSSTSPAFVAILTCRVIVGRPLVLEKLDLSRDDNSSALAEASGAFFDAVARSDSLYHSAVLVGPDADIAVVANPAADSVSVAPMVDPSFMTIMPFSLAETLAVGQTTSPAASGKSAPQPRGSRRDSQ